MAHIAADEPDKTAEKTVHELLMEAFADAHTEAIITKVLSASVAEANAPIIRQVEAMNRRLDKLLLSLAPVRTSLGRHH